MKHENMKIAWKILLKYTCCMIFLFIVTQGGYAQHLGNNIVTNGDFGKLPEGADASTYRQQYSNGVGPEEGEEFFAGYMSSGNFSVQKHQYVLAAKMNAFYAAWKNITASDKGLMMIVEGAAAKVGASKTFYKRSFHLPAGNVYHFSMDICNVWNQQGHGFLNALRIFDPWIKVNYNSEEHKTDQIGYKDGWVTLEFDLLAPDEGTAMFEFVVGHTAGGTGLGNDAWGTDFAIDNIQLKPYLLTPGQIQVSGCQVFALGKFVLTSSVTGGPSGKGIKYGRWMRKVKGSDTWEWVQGTEVQTENYTLEQDTATFRQSEYRVLFSFSKNLLNSFEIPPTELSDNYAFSEIYTGKVFPTLTLGIPEWVCKTGTALNSGTVEVNVPEGVSEISWQIDEGEITAVPCTDGEKKLMIGFEFGANNQTFKLVSYKVPEFCSEPLLLDGISFDLKPLYIPNTVPGDINAENVVICNGDTGMLEAELARKVIQNPVFYWYDQADMAGEALATGSSVAVPADLTVGTHTFYVTLKADNRCPAIPGQAKEVTVNINNKAVAAEITVNGSFTECEHVPLALTASADENAGIINPQFEWYTSADFAQESLLAVAPAYYGDSLLPGVQHLYVRMWADNRCRNLAGEGKEIEVNIIPRSGPDHIVVKGNTPICREDELHLTVSVASGHTVTRPLFRWYADAGLTQLINEGVSESGEKFIKGELLPGQHHWFVTLEGDEVCGNEPGRALCVAVTVLDSLQLPVIPVDTVRIFKDEDAVLALDIQSAEALQYEWYATADMSGGVIGTERTVTISGLAEGIHSFYVRMKDTKSCWSRMVEMPVRVYPATNIRVDDIWICQGNPGILSVQTALSGLEFSWSNLADGSNDLGHEQSLLLPATLEAGEHVYYVEVKDNTTQLTVRKAAKVTVVPRAAIGGKAFGDDNIFCVGHVLKIPFEVLEHAVKYRVTLKSTTLEAYDFPEYTAEVTPEILASGELPVSAEDYVIPAGMSGAGFVLEVELTGQTLNNGGVIETCSTVRDFTFSVKRMADIVVEEPDVICNGGSLRLIPAVTWNGNTGLGYEWRMETQNGEEVLQEGEMLDLTGLTGAWNGRHIWCCVRTECGWQKSNRVTLRVYDEAFNTISYEGEDVYAGMMAKITGSEVPLNGLLYSWEYKPFWGDWTALEGKNTVSIYLPVDCSASFRRIVKAGACSSISNEVSVNVAEFTDSTDMDEGLGRYVYQETFGYVSQFEWEKENGDKRNILTYRKFDHTGGINTSKYSVHHYEMKSQDEWEESVNDIDRLPEENPLLFYSGDWVFEETSTNLLAEPWGSKYKHNPAYVWCKDFGIVYNNRTAYVENGTYCSGSSLYNQPARWFNINGAWKIGYWYRYFYSGKSPSMGDGKYGLTPCPYEMDPNTLIKYSKSLDHTQDPAGETGLMLMVNSKDSDVAYSRTVSGLTGGIWYQLEVWVAKAENGGLNGRPNIKVEVNGAGVTGEDGLPDPSFKTGSLERNADLKWTRCTVNFFVPEGVTQVKYAVYNTNGGGAGNVFVLDDISVREILVRNWNLAADFCEQPGDLKFTLSNEVDLPEYAVVYSRLMRKNKDAGEWEWAGEVSDSMKIAVASEQVVNYDFRTVEAFSPTLLERIDPNNPAEANHLGYYAVTEKYTMPDFCLVLNSYQVDYVSVSDSVVIEPVFSGVPEGAKVYSRFLFRPFGAESWEWHGGAALQGSHYLPWMDLLEGDCKVVYAFSAALLDAVKAEQVVERTDYYVASEVIPGIRPVLTITEKITDGQVVLKPEVEGLPMGASPAGCWMRRSKGTEQWEWLPMNKELNFTASLFAYSAGEYRFVYTQSRSLIDTLSVQQVGNGGRGYIVSDIFSGKEYSIGELTADFCKSPGNVVVNLDFSSEYPDDVEIHGRWRQKSRDGEEWEWMSNVVYGLPDFNVNMSGYLGHDYELVLSWSRDSLRNWQSGSLPTGNEYYRICSSIKELPVCISVDTIRIVSVDSAKFELCPEVSSENVNAVLAGRWMKAPSGTGQWEWNGKAGTGNVRLVISEEELGAYDYRYVSCLEPELLNNEVIGEKKPYLVEDTLKSVTIVRPELGEVKVLCMEVQDSNRVELTFVCPEEIAAITYRTGENEGQTVSVENQQTIVFSIGSDEVFTLESYDQKGVCDRIIFPYRVPLAYRARPLIGNMTDMFACLDNEIEIIPEIKGTGTLRSEWYKNGDDQPFSEADTLRMVMDRPDTLSVRLVVDGDEVCPSVREISVVAADYPGISRENVVQQVCVGEPFRIPYQAVRADQYRVAFKESSMSGFTFYSGVRDVGERTEGYLDVFSGQAPLYATEFMAGHRFVFQLRLYRYTEYNGVTYRCDKDVEVVFEVKPKPESRYIGTIYACADEQLNLAPEVEVSGNQVSGYSWRLWNGDSLQIEKVLVQTESGTELNAVVDSSWNGKRLQLLVHCECGEVVVQDIPVDVFDNRKNRIFAPAGIVFYGENICIEGTELGTNSIEYQWEAKSEGEDWTVLAGENKADLNIRVPEVESVYRRQIISEGFSCQDKSSNAVALRVYNNELENLIQMKAADTLVNKGAVVTVTGKKAVLEEVHFVWQKNDSGLWEDLETADAGTIDITVNDMTMIRRKAIAGEREMYSNVLLVNVYDVAGNKIMAPLTLVLPGDKVKLIGNCFNIAGVKYSWWVKKETATNWELLENADSWNLEWDPEESASYKREVSLPTGEVLESNVVQVTVFDNEQDNVIRCEKQNVCGNETVTVAGKEVGGPETIYRWERSEDNGNTWEVIDGENAASWTVAVRKSMLLRRFIVDERVKESSSNILEINVIHGTEDNTIAFAGTVFSGQEAEIKGSEVKNAVYSWEKSEGGLEDWQVIAGESGSSLILQAEETTKECYFRRRLKFEDSGCEVVSEVLKMVIMDQQRNRIEGPAKAICQWSGFTLTGEDLADVGATYQWYYQKSDNWEPCEYAFQKDLIVYEGIAQDRTYRRNVKVRGQEYESNIVNVKVWNSDGLDNAVEQPGLVCAGVEVVLKGSDLSAPEWKDYVKDYYWVKSVTAAGNSWVRADSSGGKDLVLSDAEETEWYCRVVTTYCGDELRSIPVLVDVKERLPLTLRHNASFGKMKVKDPIRISVDEDFYRSYELKVDDEVKPVDQQEFLFYGWAPKKDYQIVANVISDEGCFQTDTIRMRTPDVDLPNVLTPNEDGYNDVLLPGYELKIYNRWGNLMYSGTEGWDGRYKGNLVAAGTYFYVVKIQHFDGGVAEYRKSVTVKRD